jgi:hypothetical protein
MIKDAPPDIQESFQYFKDEINQIATVEDLDYLYVKLNGQGADLLLKAIEEEEKANEDEEEQE